MATKKTVKKPASKKAAKSTPKTPVKAAKKADAPAPAKARDPGLPAPGGVLERTYKNQKITVQVTETGFTYNGAEYSSLTAVALKITGYRAVSGPRFFGLVKPAPTPAAAADAAEGGAR
jgi:hypothetical protein